MCETTKGDAPDPRSTKEQLYATAAHIRDRAENAAHAERKRAFEYGANEPCRPRLRERVHDSFHRAAGESQKLDRLRELAELLDTNPAVARILELIEETRV